MFLSTRNKITLELMLLIVENQELNIKRIELELVHHTWFENPFSNVPIRISTLFIEQKKHLMYLSLHSDTHIQRIIVDPMHKWTLAKITGLSSENTVFIRKHGIINYRHLQQIIHITIITENSRITSESITNLIANF